MKKLTKKFKDVKVEITFAESKEYDTVKESFIENISDNDKIKKEKAASRVLSKLKKEQIQEEKGHQEEKGTLLRRKHTLMKKSEGGSSKGKN